MRVGPLKCCVASSLNLLLRLNMTFAHY